MQRFFVVCVASVLWLGCPPRTDGALLVLVQVVPDEQVKGDCFEVEVISAQETIAKVNFKREAGRAEYPVAVKQGDFPATVAFRASAYLGDCAVADRRQLSSRSTAQEATFPDSRVETVVLTLSPPDATLDADRDGYVDRANNPRGSDCDDKSFETHPNAPQPCAVTSDFDCDGFIGCADPDCSAAADCLKPPSALVLSPSSATTEIEACSPAISVQSQGVTLGVMGPIPVILRTAVALSAPEGVQFFSDSNCATPPVSEVELAVGQTSTVFYYRGTKLGDFAVGAHADGLVDATLSAHVVPTPATALTFVEGPSAIVVGTCSGPFTAELQDKKGKATVTPGDLFVNIAANVEGAVFFDDAACGGAPVVGKLLKSGEGRATFWMRFERVRPLTVTAVTSSNLRATQAVLVGPAAPAKLVFSGDPGVLVNTCSTAPVNVFLRDAFDNTSPAVGAPIGVTLSADPPVGLTFYSDNKCALAATSVSIPAGFAQASVYVKGSSPGTYNMTATSPPLAGATQVANVALGPATQIRITSLPGRATAGQCSRLPVTVQTVSNENTSAPDKDLKVTWASSGSSVTFFTDDACSTAVSDLTGITIRPGSTGGSVYFLSNVAQSGFAVTVDTAGAFEASQTLSGFAILPGAQDHLVWEAPASQTIVAGGCSGQQFKLSLKDKFGNVTVFSAVASLVFGPDDVRFSIRSNCADAGTTISVAADAGQVAFYTTGTKKGLYSLTGPSISAATTGSASLTVDAGAPSALRWAVAPIGSHTIDACLGGTLELLDAYGNVAVAPSGGTSIALSASPDGGFDGGFDFYGSANCAGASVTQIQIPLGGSSASLALRGSSTAVAGKYKIHASLGVNHAANTPEVSLTPGETARIRLTNVPSSLAAGTCAENVLVLREDRAGNLTSPTTALGVSFANPSGVGNLSYFVSPTCAGFGATPQTVTISSSNSSQLFSFNGTSPTSDAGLRASATLADGGASIALASTQIVPGAVSQLVFTTPGGSTDAGYCTGPITVQSRDSFGNVANVSSNLDFQPGHNTTQGSLKFYSGNTCNSEAATVTIASGTSAQSFYFIATKAPESPTIGLTASGVSVPSQQWDVSAGSPSQLVFTSAAGATDAGYCTGPVTVQSRDSFNNVANAPSGGLVVQPWHTSARTLTFYSDNLCNSAVSTVSIPSGSSSKNFYFIATKAPETPSIGLDASVPSLPPAQDWTVSPGSPAKLVWITEPQATISLGICSSEARVQLQDGYDNPSPTAAAGRTITPTSSVPARGVTFYTDSACSATGTFTIPVAATDGMFWFRASSSTGTTDLSVTSTPLTGTTAIPVTVNSAGTLSVTAADANIEYFGCKPVVVTRSGSTLLDAVVELKIPDSANLTLHVDSSCTGPTTTSVSGNTGAGNATVAFYARGRSGAPTAVTATASSTGYADATLQLTALPLIQRGTCTIASGSSIQTCQPATTIAATSLARTFLIFQATIDDSSASSSNVACYVQSPMGNVEVVCVRQATTGSVTISWQTATWGRGFGEGGVTVGHKQVGALSAQNSQTVTLSVPEPGSSFLLFSNNSSTDSNSANDFATATRLDVNDVQLKALSDFDSPFMSCFQAVTMAGATVDRGVLPSGNGSPVEGGLAEVVGLSPRDVARTIVFHSVATADGASANAICKRRFRSNVLDASGTKLTFTRGAGVQGNCIDPTDAELAWERIELPSGSKVQAFDLTLASGNLSGSKDFTAFAVTGHRTLLLMSGQGPGGQASGETDYASASNNNTRDNLGTVHARLTLDTGQDPPQVVVTRASTSGNAIFTPFVIEFPP